MRAIWKFPLPTTGKIEMPFNSQILSVGVQNDSPFVWALVETENTTKETMLVNVYGTGHPIPSDPGRFIGTFMLSGGALVFHVFEP